MTNKGVVLLFGAFNPFTNAHLHIGRLAKEQYPQYDICYVPSRINYMLEWKGMDKSDIMSEDLRVDLIKGSVVDDAFMVSDIEIKGIVNGKTYNTVCYFKNNLGYDDVVLCMGTDKVDELETWYRGEELIAENKFLIITRGGESLASRMTKSTLKNAQNFREIKNDAMQFLSATMVREAIAARDYDRVREIVPEYVYAKLCIKEV